MAKKKKEVTQIEFIQGEVMPPVEFYAQIVAVNSKKDKIGNPEHFVGLITNDPKILLLAKDHGDAIYQVKIQAVE